MYYLENLNLGKFLKKPFFFDATASGPQMLLLILGSPSLEIYKQCNLIETGVWYDTYYFIINGFFLKNEVPQEYKEKYFTRSNLKKTIMTYNYNATYLTCWDDFKNTTGLNFILDRDLIKNIEPLFKNFYKFLKKLFNEEYYNYPSTTITAIFKEIYKKEKTLDFKNLDDFLIKFKYNTMISDKRLDRIISAEQKTRETIIFTKLSDEMDSRKTFRALLPNLIHCFDAYVIRIATLYLGKGFMTIHDSVGLSPMDIIKFKKIILKVYIHIYLLDPFKLNTNNFLLNIEGDMIFL
jgi:DNA-directed RNA polymerase